jgi:hypothetical protein
MCDCGCNICEDKKPVMLNESLAPREILSEGLKYHLDNARPLTEHVYRAGSDSYFNLWAEARALYSRNIIEVQGDDLEVLTETDLGHYGTLEDGTRVPLDFPIELNETEYNLLTEETKKKIGKPMRSSSGGKAYKVYVRDPKTKKIKTVRFGSGGLKAKINNPKARQAFAKRHNCAQKNDRTKASYWSCRLPRYAKLLGLKSNFQDFGDMIKLLDILQEAKESFEDFAVTRGKGAAKIAENAEEKGGLSLLTWHHFKVKAPYYKKAAEGKFDKEDAIKEFEDTYKKISLKMTQTEFQREVGRLEVLGELLIREK